MPYLGDEVAAPVCQGSASMPELQRCLGAAMTERLFTAAQCVASTGTELVHRDFLGTAVPPPPRQQIDHNTFFDLEDLTMPLATGVAAMWLVQQQRLDLQLTVQKALPAFAAPHFAQITVDMLLDHSSGLPATAALIEQGSAPQRWGQREHAAALQEALRNVPLERPPGTAAQPSSLGFLLLGWIIEAVVRQPLDRFLAKEIYGPWGLADALLFVPPTGKLAVKRRFVSTRSSPLRGRLCCGEVADDLAWAQGGVAGHAGLFGTATGIWRLCQALLHGYRGEQPTLLGAATLKRFWTRSRRFGTSRTLGWDTPTMLPSSAGKRLPRTAVGQVSPQGPSLWLDPQSQFVGVLLINQVPTVPAARLLKLRARIFELLTAQAAAGPPPGSEGGWDKYF